MNAKPRILYVINSFNPGGAEIGLLTLVTRGFFEKCDLFIVGLASGEGPVYDRLVEVLGQDRVFYLQKARDVSDVRLPFFTAALGRVFWRVRPDIAILSLPQSIVCGRAASLLFPHMRIVTFEHSVRRARRIADLLLKATSFRVDLLFGDAERTVSECERLYLKRVPSIEVPLASVQLSPPRVWSVPQTLNLLTFGRLAPEKNYEELLHAFSSLVRSGVNARLQFAGDGKLRETLQTLATELGIGERVEFLGFVQETEELLTSSHIYVQPSLREGLAISVLQAMGAGLIVVASDVGAIRDYGIDQVNMIKIASPAAAADVTQGLRKAIDAYGNLQHMSLMAQEKASALCGDVSVKRKWKAAQQALYGLIV